MKDQTTQDNYFVRLTGKGNIPKELEIGRNYELKTSGTVTSVTESDNDDGSHTKYFTFKPIVIELVTDKGESIRAKDTRSLSQLFRARAWKAWNKKVDGGEFETYYNGLMMNLIQQAEEVIGMYEN